MVEPKRVIIKHVTHADNEASYTFEPGLCSYRYPNDGTVDGYIAVHFGTERMNKNDHAYSWIYMDTKTPLFKALIKLDHKALVETLKNVTVESYTEEGDDWDIHYKIIFDPKLKIEPIGAIEQEKIPMMGIF